MFRRLTFVHWSRPEVRTGRQIQLHAVVAGIMWAILVTLFLGVILALWVTLSTHSRFQLSGLLFFAVLAGALAGGVTGGINARKHGWLNGGMVGLTYGLLFLAVIVGGSRGTVFGLSELSRLPVLAAVGAAGGIIGVNVPGDAARPLSRPGPKRGRE